MQRRPKGGRREEKGREGRGGEGREEKEEQGSEGNNKKTVSICMYVCMYVERLIFPLASSPGFPLLCWWSLAGV